MHRLFAALVVASIAVVAAAAPSAAQSCSDFGSRKAAQQQLEQVGDPAGVLDTDQDGYACEDELPDASSAQTVPLSGAVTINQDGPETSDDASGDSGTTVSTAPGAENATAAEGEGNAEEETSDVAVTDEDVVAGDATAGEDAAAAGDAAVTNDETGETAAAGDALAVDTDDEEVCCAPEEPKPAPEEPEKAAPAPEVAPAPEAPVQLPNTGAGVAGESGLGGLVLALLGLAAATGLVAVRRFQRA